MEIVIAKTIRKIINSNLSDQEKIQQIKDYVVREEEKLSKRWASSTQKQ